MFFEGCIETTAEYENLQLVGLDTADERRLLDQQRFHEQFTLFCSVLNVYRRFGC